MRTQTVGTRRSVPVYLHAGRRDAIPDLRNPLLHFLYWRVLFEPAHFLMERKMLLGIKQRAEGSASRRFQRRCEAT